MDYYDRLRLRAKIDDAVQATGGYGTPIRLGFTALTAKVRLQYIVSKDRIRTSSFRFTQP